MEYRKLGVLDTCVSAVGLGTWVTGGWMWGGSDEGEVTRAVESALERGINFIDTAPIYGFGRAEEIVGRVIKRLGIRRQVVLATKFGLCWDERHKKIWRDCSRNRILEEFGASCQRLQTDCIDLYQVHWPDRNTPLSETMEVLQRMFKTGQIKSIGLCNFNVSELAEAKHFGPVHAAQSPYNLFERDIEESILPYCQSNHLGLIAYGALCRGLLSGKFNADAHFPKSDLRRRDPKFRKGQIESFLHSVDKLRGIAERKNLKVSQLAIQWCARRQGVTSALVGARNEKQAMENAAAFDVLMDEETLQEINIIMKEMRQDNEA